MPLWGRMMYRMAVPFMIPFILLDAIKTKVVPNPLHDGKRELTGRKRVYVSKAFKLDECKVASKALNLTINEMMTASLSVTLKKLFEDMGDHKTTEIKIGLPVNIRW